MAEGLQYKIGADVSDFNAGVKQVETNLNKLSATSTKAIRNISTSANQGAFALNSLGQVARDLPFGFIAIQNNLPIVIDQFGSLVKTSGGVGGALKSLGAALIGPAGITFAFGAVIAGATALISKYGSLGQAVQALANGNNAQYKQQQQLIEIQKEAAKSAGEEIAKLEVLNAVAIDVTASTDKRKEAANQMLKVYKDYLPQVSQEAILNNQAADAINRAKDALLNKALAAAGENKLAEIGGKLLENQLSLETAEKRLIKAKELNRAAAEKGAKEGIKGIASVNTETVAYAAQLEQATNNVNELKRQQAELNAEFERTRQITSGFAKLIPTVTPKAVTPSAAATRRAPEVLLTPKINTADPGYVAVATDEIIAAFEEENKTNPILLPVNIDHRIPESAKASIEAFLSQQDGLRARVTDLTNSFNNLLAPAIDTIFGALANGSNVFEAINQSLKAMVAQFAIAIAKSLILAAVINSIPGAGVASGLGKGFGSIFAGLFKGNLFAEGGIVTRPTAGIFGEAGPEAVMPLDKLNSMIGNIGGGMRVQFEPLRVRGNDLVASNYRTTQIQGRSF